MRKKAASNSTYSSETARNAPPLAAGILYYGVKTVRTRQPPQAVLRSVAWIIKRLIAEYDPEVLAIEKTFIIQKSAALLTVVAEEIKAAAGGQGLVIFEYAPLVVRKLICQTGKATKSEVAKAVALRFPELSRYLNRQSKWEAIYWANMFDAVAVGLVCMMNLETKSSEGQTSEQTA